jgi:hypothetical protein
MLWNETWFQIVAIGGGIAVLIAFAWSVIRGEEERAGLHDKE